MSSKTSDLTEVTSTNSEDMIEISHWNGSGFDSRKISIANFLKGTTTILDTVDLTNGGANDQSEILIPHLSAWDDYRDISIEVHGLTVDTAGKIGIGVRTDSGNSTLINWVSATNISRRIISPFAPADDLGTDGFASFGMTFYRTDAQGGLATVSSDFAGGRKTGVDSMAFDNANVDLIWGYSAAWVTENPSTAHSLYTWTTFGWYGYQIMNENGNFNGGVAIVKGTRI
jgi:hypothetical protein